MTSQVEKKIKDNKKSNVAPAEISSSVITENDMKLLEAEDMKWLDDVDGLLKILEDAGPFLIQSKPPDMKLIRRKFCSGMKDSFVKSAPIFAAEMSINGFMSKDIDNTCSVRVDDKVVLFKDARKLDFKFEKDTKGLGAVNPRRVCMAFATSTRKYISKNKITTSTMKKYAVDYDFMFIGGQESIDSSSDANKMIDVVNKVDGLVSAKKLVKYFMARKIKVDNIEKQ